MKNFLENATPFFLPGDKRGIILVHGFTGSPAEMLPLGNYLHSLGFSVICPRLAGHGTSPEDMERTSWRDWYYCVCDAYYLLQKFCQSIDIVGLSMGSLLALRAACQFPLKRAAILSVPINLAAARGLSLLPAREKSNSVFIIKPQRRLISPKPVGYRRMPLLCVHELLSCIEDVKQRLNKVHCPLLIVQSKNDRTVEYTSAPYVYERVSSIEKKIVSLEKSGHIVTLDCEQDIVFAALRDFLLPNNHL